MEAVIWQRLPEELLYMILARLPMRVLGKMRSVCKKWNYLLSSRDALQVNVRNWSLHSTPGFLIQIHCDFKYDDEYWVIEGRGSEIYKLRLPHLVVVGTCKGIICICRKGDSSALSLGIPGIRNWRHLPPPPTSGYYWFSGLAFDPSTRRCTLLLGDHMRQQDTIRIVMSIYDLESNAWAQVSMMVPYAIQPRGKAIYFKGKFYWVSIRPRNLIVAFNIANGVWTEIPLPQGCTTITGANLGEYYGQLVLVEHEGLCSVRMWKFNEAQVWCHLHTFRLEKGGMTSFDSVRVHSRGLMMVMDGEMNISIYDWKGKSIISGMRLPGLRTSQRLFLTFSASSFESTNLWWP